MPTAENPWLLSVNHLKEWDKCRKQFYYKTVLKQRWVSDDGNFELGKSVHALMDYAARDLPTAHLLEQVTPQIRESFLALNQHPISQEAILASEFGFHIPFMPDRFPHVYLVGRMDRVIQQNDTLSIIDWKTGTAVPHDYATAWQTRLYLYALEQLKQQLGHADLPLSFIYVDVRLNRQQRVNTYVTEANEGYQQETGTLLIQRIEAILNEQSFTLPRECPDKYCPYGGVCGINEPDVAQLPLFSLPTVSVLGDDEKPEALDPFDAF